jgi:4a-hydroxytetrahydrobiopterin dehydratase
MAGKLSESEVQDKLAQLDGWALSNEEIIRTFQVKDFQAALMLVNAAGLLAEASQHHPDITIKYNRVMFALVTHDAGGLTDKDFDLATQINALPLLK